MSSSVSETILGIMLNYMWALNGGPRQRQASGTNQPINHFQTNGFFHKHTYNEVRMVHWIYRGGHISKYD